MLVPGKIYPGSTERRTVTYRDSDGVLLSPDTVTFTLYSPSGVETTYTLGTDSNIQELSTGKFACDFTVGTEAGRWRFRWVGTETSLLATVVNEGEFVVQWSPSLQDVGSDYYYSRY